MFVMLRNFWKPDPLSVFAKSNSVTGAPQKRSGKFEVHFAEGGNTLIIEEDVEFINVRLQFQKTGNVMIFRAGCSVHGHFIATNGTIEIGKGTRFNKPCRLQANEGKSIKVGQKCLFADVNMRTSDIHSVISTETGRRLNLAKDIEIGDRVWIAERTSVYKGVTIGSGSIVGAHSVVVKSAPRNCTIAGNPARVVRENVSWRPRLLGPEGDPTVLERKARKK